ncbi:MAG TPA: hypothetical protein VEU97_03990 [Ktedonobacteraceae bacterium]|nr:hypothetical protein [Ktedonobacteraceae bacterium]
MQSRERNNTYAHMPAAVQLPSTAEENVEHWEASRVFYCMQCDFQYQMDRAVTGRKGSDEIDEEIVRVRLDHRTRLEREA